MFRRCSLKLFLAFTAFGILTGTQPDAYASSIVYDNTSTQVTSFLTNFEFGDEITLAGTDRVVTEFLFGYHANGSAFGHTFTVEGDETARIRFYDKVANLPGPVLYDSGAFNIPAGIIGTHTLTNLSVSVPDTFIWTIEFGGIDLNESAGLQVYSPPTVGSSDDTYWGSVFGSWEERNLPGGGPANFYARVTATTASVPEPSTLFLLASGLVGLRLWGKRMFGI